jgi:cell division protein FtsL
MEQEILNRLQTQEELLQKVYASVEKTRKYFVWTLIATAVMFILPLIGLMFVIPSFMQTMTSSYSSVL